jgi:hypothetical protein
MIVPTVGRMVLYRITSIDNYEGFVPGRDYAAVVVDVHSERCISVAAFNSSGQSFGKTSIPLLQDDDPIPASGSYCCWMPYQKQAASGEIKPTLHATK